MAFTPRVQDGILRRREQVPIYDTLDPARTALVVVDMQNAFCKPGGILSVDSARSIVPNINTLAASLRRAGGSVFWIQMKIASKAHWPVYLGDLVSRPDAVEAILADLSPTGEGTELWPELQVDPADTVLPKDRFSAFLSKACTLMEHLDRKGIDTVIIAGTLTNICCESSARDAAMHDYKVVFPSDANAARYEDVHERSLETIAQCFGDVRTTEDIVAMIDRGR
ncbi:isochorismatase family cysteine hydrolase [Ramlibacter sp. AN1015]|uniref:isochorismatase family cysteine hydrolase n=1 Tax=Ramlibacter sp. AN1015 TaxID=3133428 RepID=UPI0030C2D050